MEHRSETFDRIEGWLGISLDTGQREALLGFERWLGDEAGVAGGIGPAESERLFDRHVIDSLAFLTRIPEHARTAVDVGGGVGLPSIPLAIARPDLDLTLLDRSRRRTDLAARAGRILGVRNLSILTQDVSTLVPTFDVALFRASLPIVPAARSLGLCVRSPGIGLLAVSRKLERPAIPSEPDGITFALSKEGEGVLQTPFWLLTMRFR